MEIMAISQSFGTKLPESTQLNRGRCCIINRLHTVKNTAATTNTASCGGLAHMNASTLYARHAVLIIDTGRSAAERRSSVAAPHMSW